MKIKSYLLASIMALGALFTGCSSDNDDENFEQKGEGVLKVSLASGTSTRSLETLDDDKINHYHVYIFSWGSGVLEAQKTGDPSKTTQFTGLSTATSKRVVVLTNMDNYPSVTNYAELGTSVHQENLDVQDPDVVKTKGFIMSGQSATAVTLKAAGPNVETVKLERIVAKISLETLTFIPAAGHDITKFEVLGLSAQRVSRHVSLAPVTPFYNDPNHFGGYEGSDPLLITKTYLKDESLLPLGSAPYDIDSPYTLGNYFLVFPNSSPNDCTLFTIKGKYDGEVMYYPIKVNYQAVTGGGNTSDGTFVKNNKHYKLHITLKKIGEGGTDPEIPNEQADLDVVIQIEDWSPIIQYEEW